MARYQLILAYDGTDLEGSQRQRERRTVQGELEAALRRLGWTGRSVLMAGRTDTGVHAEGQSVSLDLEWPHDPEALRTAINAHLPPDLAVRLVREVPADFHPRYHATSRLYRYRVFFDPVRHPLRERYAWRVWPAVDGEVLQSVAACFLGRHDFAAFGSPTRPGGSTVRTVLLSTWHLTDGEWHYWVRADAFLYRMVRRLVYVQVMVAQGRLALDQVKQALQGLMRLPAGLAPAHGLCLMEVTYADQPSLMEELEWQCSRPIIQKPEKSNPSGM